MLLWLRDSDRSSTSGGMVLTLRRRVPGWPVRGRRRPTPVIVEGHHVGRGVVDDLRPHESASG